MNKNQSLSLLGIIALIVVIAGATTSLGFVLYAGRKNASVVLPVLFIAWVLLPFTILIMANLYSLRRPANRTLHILTIVVSLISVVAYSGLLTPPQSKPAGVFLVVPLLSLVAIAVSRVFSKKQQID